MLLSVDALRVLGRKVFVAGGVPDEVAAAVTDALVLAELDGIPSHGFSRIPFYVDQARSGKVDARAEAVLHMAAPSLILMDAACNFAFPAIERGLAEALPLCRRYGVVMVGVRRSHHCGVLGHFAEKMARQGVICLAFANTPAAMAPWGGAKATFGTNPLALGCPRDPDPLVVDMSLSTVARGKIMNAGQKGESIPEGWALDADGQPTTDARKALQGTMLPFGGAKGAALALMVEILAATLPGARHAYEASSFFEAEGEAPGTGQSFLLVDCVRFNPGFADRLEALLGHMLAQEGVRLPGERRFRQREERRRTGVELPDALWQDLCRRAEGGPTAV